MNEGPVVFRPRVTPGLASSISVNIKWLTGDPAILINKGPVAFRPRVTPGLAFVRQPGYPSNEGPVAFRPRVTSGLASCASSLFYPCSFFR
jgi:hypothetical protein